MGEAGTPIDRAAIHTMESLALAHSTQRAVGMSSSRSYATLSGRSVHREAEVDVMFFPANLELLQLLSIALPGRKPPLRCASTPVQPFRALMEVQMLAKTKAAFLCRATQSGIQEMAKQHLQVMAYSTVPYSHIAGLRVTLNHL